MPYRITLTDPDVFKTGWKFYSGKYKARLDHPDWHYPPISCWSLQPIIDRQAVKKLLLDLRDKQMEIYRANYERHNGILVVNSGDHEEERD